MRIAILSAGSRGDTQPYVALGVALQQAGHTVTLAASEGFEPFVTGQGLTYSPVTGNFQAILAGQAGNIGGKGSANPLWMAPMLRRMIGPIMAQMGRDLLAASQDAEVVISALPLLGGDVAEALGAIYFPASLFPFIRTRAFGHPFLPPNLPGLLNGPSFTLAGQLAWQMFRPVINRFRRDSLDLPPIGARGPFQAEQAAGHPTLYAFSPHVIPPPVDWPAHVHVTGYWWLDTPDWTPPADLLAFLAAGPAPVFIGFGSMPDADPAATTRLILDALERTRQRAILHTGWGGIGALDLPDSVYRIDFAPYEWLFPRMAAVIHHGGAGTTGLALRAGVPSQVVAFIGDQAWWGTRVQRLGAGLAQLRRQKLTVDRLATAIQTLTRDETIRARAAELGAQIQAEDGLARALEIIHRHLEG